MVFASPVVSESWVNWFTSAGILLVFVGLAFASRVIVARILHMIARQTKTEMDDLIIQALSTPMFAALVAAGLWLALVRNPDLSHYDPITHKFFAIVFIGIVAVALIRVTNALSVWYVHEVSSRTETDLDDKLIPILRRVATLVIYVIAVIIVLDQLGVNITPLIAGLGIGGLAVAMALQPTLSNFLAGTYVMTDAVIRKGHYIALDSGQEGFVEEIGWRTTKIRNWQGNLIVLPNSKMSDSIITNFERPDASMVFTVSCGVGYESDLNRVERVVLEVAADVMQKCSEGAKDFKPVLRFNEFGDSNVNFTVALKAVDRPGHFALKHEFIKALHHRFQEEGIAIEYPVRRLYFADTHTDLGPAPAQLLKKSAGSTAIEDKK